MGGGFLSWASRGGEDCHGHRMLEWEEAAEGGSNLAKGTRDLHEVTRRAGFDMQGSSAKSGVVAFLVLVCVYRIIFNF